MSGPLDNRGTPLEYWFVRAQDATLAFLVDFIVRRRSGTAEVRLSYWLRGAGTVVHDVASRWTEAPDGVVIGPCSFAGSRTRGRAGPVSWDLRFSASRWIEPGRVPALLASTDIAIASAPGARITGTVVVGSHTSTFDDAPGLVSHYWAVRLPDRWAWLAVNTAGLALEAVVTRTRVWRLPWPRVPVAYVYVSSGARERYVISPLTGFAAARGAADAITVRAWSPVGRGVRIEARRTASITNDLGEGIGQTLIADAVIDGATVDGSVGYETRGWS